MSEEFKKRFWGSRKVVNIEETDHKTPAKTDIIKLIFEDGDYEFTTILAYNEFSTKKKSDDTDLRTRQHKFLNQKLLVMLMEYGGVKHGDVQHLAQGLADQIFESFNRASNYLWTKNDNLFVPGVSSIDQRSLIETDCILNSMEQVD